MEGSLKTYEAYRNRALNELKQLNEMVDSLMPETGFSRAYYTMYYAIKAQLELKGIHAKSHKETMIAFRHHFIRTKLIDNKYSRLLTTIFEKREMADYDILWLASKSEFKKLLSEVNNFVHLVLSLSDHKAD